MSASLIKQFEESSELSKEQAAQFVQFGYMRALTDILRKHKTKETMDITLDQFIYAREINPQELHKQLLIDTLETDIALKLKKNEKK